MCHPRLFVPLRRYLSLETYVRLCYDVVMRNLKLDLKSGKKQQHMIHSMTQADVVLIVVCLLSAILLGTFFMVHRRTGSTISISHDGVELYIIDLEDIHSDKNTQYYLICYEEEQTGYTGQDVHIMHFEQYPEVPAEQSYNLFSVTNGTVTMEAADCKDQVCVRHIPISSDRESIICLPNKLVIEMSGSAAFRLKQPEETDHNGIPEDGTDESLDGVVG